MENSKADGVNGILKNATKAVILKYLCIFLRLLKIPLINCQVELKLKWTKHFVLATNVADNRNANSIIIYTIKDTTLFVPVVTLLGKGNQVLSKLLSKWFERSVYWNEDKTKCENKKNDK